MKTIILDTNALMAMAQFKIDIFSELEKVCDFRPEIKILDKTLKELKKIIREQKGKNKEAAKLVLKIIKDKKIKKIKIKGEEKKEVDDLLVFLAEKGAIVVTQDKELKRRIKRVGGKIMTIRQKKKVVFS